MTDVIIVLVLVIVLGAAGFYIYKAKKSGKKCIGCPYSQDCNQKQCNCSNEK